MSNNINLTEQEIDALKFLVNRFNSHDRNAYRINTSELKEHLKTEETETNNLIMYFAREAFIKIESNQSFSVLEKAAQHLESIENPEPRNEFNELVAWWFSKKWRAIISIIVIILPLIVQWIQMIQFILSWVTGSSNTN